MFAIIRYTVSDTLHAQRWVAPIVSLGVIVAVVSAQTGSLLPTFAILATALVFVSTWLTVVVVDNEDPVQQTITETCSGSRAKVRIAKLLLSLMLCSALGFLAMVPPIFVSTDRVRFADLLAGGCAQAIGALAAVGLGALCSRPVVRRHAWSVLLGILVGLGTILIPDGVPSRQLLVAFDKTGQVALALPIVLIGLETVVICALAVAASIKLSSSRS